MNAHALAICQARHDARLPDDEQAFLDTSTGANWLSDAAETLLNGRDLALCGAVVVHAYELSDAAANEAIRRTKEGVDQEGLLGQLLVAVDNYDITTASACLKSLFHDWRGPRGVFHKCGEDLCRPHAERAAEQLRRDNEDDFNDMRYSA